MLCAPWRPFNASATDVSLPNAHRKRPPAQRVRSSASSGHDGGPNRTSELGRKRKVKLRHHSRAGENGSLDGPAERS